MGCVDLRIGTWGHVIFEGEAFTSLKCFSMILCIGMKLQFEMIQINYGDS
jgi:hypothetical protein